MEGKDLERRCLREEAIKDLFDRFCIDATARYYGLLERSIAKQQELAQQIQQLEIYEFIQQAIFRSGEHQLQ